MVYTNKGETVFLRVWWLEMAVLRRDLTHWTIVSVSEALRFKAPPFPPKDIFFEHLAQQVST